MFQRVIFRANHISYTWRDTCMKSLAPFEIVLGSEDWEAVDLEELYTPDIDRGHYDSWGVKETYMLEKRPIQLLRLNKKILSKSYANSTMKMGIII